MREVIVRGVVRSTGRARFGSFTRAAAAAIGTTTDDKRVAGRRERFRKRSRNVFGCVDFPDPNPIHLPLRLRRGRVEPAEQGHGGVALEVRALCTCSWGGFSRGRAPRALAGHTEHLVCQHGPAHIGRGREKHGVKLFLICRVREVLSVTYRRQPVLRHRRRGHRPHRRGAGKAEGGAWRDARPTQCHCGEPARCSRH